jgi:hypothetical protein
LIAPVRHSKQRKQCTDRRAINSHELNLKSPGEIRELLSRIQTGGEKACQENRRMSRKFSGVVSKPPQQEQRHALNQKIAQKKKRAAAVKYEVVDPEEAPRNRDSMLVVLKKEEVRIFLVKDQIQSPVIPGIEQGQWKV